MRALPFALFDVIIDPNFDGAARGFLFVCGTDPEGAECTSCVDILGEVHRISRRRLSVGYRLATAEERASSPWPCAAPAEVDATIASLRNLARLMTEIAEKAILDAHAEGTGARPDLAEIERIVRIAIDATNAAANAYRASRGVT